MPDQPTSEPSPTWGPPVDDIVPGPFPLPMDDAPTAAAVDQDWTPERIQQYMATEHGINWGPPSVEQTHQEEVVMPNDEWFAVDPKTMELRTLTSDELFDFTEAVKAGEQIRDELADVPRDHPPTMREATYTQAAMKEYGVPAETRAQAHWSARMNEQQARSASMARHPSAQSQPLRPVVS